MDNEIVNKNKSDQDNNLPWFEGGLRFECQRCGRCCRGEPGVVWVNKKEVEEISAFLGISETVFARHYLRSVNGRLSLLEYGHGDCIMYDNGCKIYAVRPCQCRTFPFWTWNVESESEWEKVKRTCPGIGKGKLHTLKDIQGNLKVYGERFDS
ncbi:MAG: YkgJ family cysteine cluster protein [wastewater metagenome]|nr:YkgJ family cysteine cluster protein [Candidatus Loosdrechtia aerotolerans]